MIPGIGMIEARYCTDDEDLPGKFAMASGPFEWSDVLLSKNLKGCKYLNVPGSWDKWLVNGL